MLRWDFVGARRLKGISNLFETRKRNKWKSRIILDLIHKFINVIRFKINLF